MSEFRGYRPCPQHTSESKGHYIGRKAGCAMLICLTCHQAYYMDSNGVEVSEPEIIQRLLEMESKP